ncbi:hypothetical protein C2G38_563700 [Gigaspora rosea]|uniref:SPRY domain-containing protein n=1 Tax=Gigaspora rosea TaxID=44941 RepID=A0A397VTD3_9GLOM|nr:hypothetical protein C2G38_563700 [Gigaspora rosea]
MGETTLFNSLVLPTAWNIDDKSQFISIDSSGLKVNYTDPNDYTVVIRANNPIPSQRGLFYFEIEIIKKGKNGMIGVGYCTKQNNISDFMPGRKYVEDKEIKENKSWGCAYHGDDGEFFCSGSGKPYGPEMAPKPFFGDSESFGFWIIASETLSEKRNLNRNPKPHPKPRNLNRNPETAKTSIIYMIILSKVGAETLLCQIRKFQASDYNFRSLIRNSKPYPTPETSPEHQKYPNFHIHLLH